MCGIIAVKRFDGLPVFKMVEKRYRKQSTRGTEGFGFVSLKNGVFEDFRKSELERPILVELRQKQGNEVMFHHRKPTSTENLWEAAHPIKVTHASLKYDYYVVHNGSIKETEKLKPEHEKAGYDYNTLIQTVMVTKSGRSIPSSEKWNDSESFAIELAKDLDGGQVGLPHLNGNVAFVCMQMEKETGKAVNLFWGRNVGSPLKFEKNNHYMIVSSEGNGTDIKAHFLNSFDYATGQISEKGYICGYSTTTTGGTYSDHWGRRDSDFYNTHRWDKDLREWVLETKVEVKSQDAAVKVEIKVETPVPPQVTAPESRELSVLPERDELHAMFDPYREIPVIGNKNSLEQDLDEMTELIGQIKSVEESLAKDNLDDADRAFLTTHRLNIIESLRYLESKYPLIVQQPDGGWGVPED